MEKMKKRFQMVPFRAYYSGPTIMVCSRWRHLYYHSFGYRVARCIFKENVITPRELKRLHTVYQVGMYIGPYAQVAPPVIFHGLSVINTCQ